MRRPSATISRDHMLYRQVGWRHLGMKFPYISGPMSNIEHHNFPAFFQCELELLRDGYESLNPARMSGVDTWEEAVEQILQYPETWESCIRRDVSDVLHSDGIVLLPNWHKSRGACLELIISISIGNRVAVWFPGRELMFIDEPSIHYDMAVDTLKRFGIISPVDMYKAERPVLY